MLNEPLVLAEDEGDIEAVCGTVSLSLLVRLSEDVSDLVDSDERLEVVETDEVPQIVSDTDTL